MAKPDAIDDLAATALEAPVAEDRPGSPFRDHKMVDSRAGQPQDMGVSLRDNSNNPCNVHGAFPPSPDERQPFWSVGENGRKAIGYDAA